MSKTAFTFLLLFYVFSCFSQQPTSARIYTFNVPDFNDLLTFNARELEIIKTSKIRTVEIRDAHNTATYFFDERGLMQSHEIFFTTRNKKIISETATYSYNKRNQLVFVRKVSVDGIYCDSLHYDNDGYLDYYLFYSVMEDDETKKMFNTIIYEYVLQSVSDCSFMQEK